MANNEEQAHAQQLNQVRAVSREAMNLSSIDNSQEALEYMGQSLVNAKLPKSASLPVIMLFLAAVKDAIDIGLTFLVIASAGFLIIFTIIFGAAMSIVFGITIGIWVSQKVGIVRKLLFKRVIIRTIVFMFFGSIPGLKLFPEATLLVLLTYSNEFKIVNGIFSTMEKATGKVKIT